MTPFIIVGISKNIYNSIDIITLVKTLVKGLNYKIEVAESIIVLFLLGVIN